MTDLKEISTDELVEELRSRGENTMPRWYFKSKLIDYELTLLEEARINAKNHAKFNPELASSAIRLAEVLLND